MAVKLTETYNEVIEREIEAAAQERNDALGRMNDANRMRVKAEAEITALKQQIAGLKDRVLKLQEYIIDKLVFKPVFCADCGENPCDCP